MSTNESTFDLVVERTGALCPAGERYAKQMLQDAHPDPLLRRAVHPRRDRPPGGEPHRQAAAVRSGVPGGGGGGARLGHGPMGP